MKFVFLILIAVIFFMPFSIHAENADNSVKASQAYPSWNIFDSLRSLSGKINSLIFPKSSVEADNLPDRIRKTSNSVADRLKGAVTGFNEFVKEKWVLINSFLDAGKKISEAKSFMESIAEKIARAVSPRFGFSLLE